MPHFRGISKTQQNSAKINTVLLPRIAQFGTLLIALFIILISCGHPSDSDKSENTQSTFDEIHLTVEHDTPFSIINKTEQTTSNIVPDSFVVAISGCDSKFSTVHDTAKSGFKIYLTKSDRNCVVGLRSLILRGTTFTNTAGGDFSGSGIAIFANSQNNEKLAVKNTAGLPSPTTPGSKVGFSFSELASGNSNFQLIIPGESSGILSEIGSEGPLLKWFNGAGRSNLVNMDSSNLPTYRVKLECNGTVWEPRNPLKSSICKTLSTQQQMGDYYLRLVDDTYANGTTLSLLQAQRLFGYTGTNNRVTPGGTGVVKVNLTSQVFDRTATNMGGVIVDLPSSSAITTCRSYLVLILHNPTGNKSVSQWSFTYFNLDFSTIRTTCQ